MSEIRVRIAPSPTGPLHIGTARTALFNALFARHHGGAFILRLEDTDVARSTSAFEADILGGLPWLGVTRDQGPDSGGGDGDGAARGAGGRTAVTLFRVPPGVIGFEDAVRGRIEIDTANLGGEFVIVRADGTPLYHFVVVVDHAAMEISHIIRGADHISTTPKHTLLFRALG